MIALIAGTGALPAVLVDRIRAAGAVPVVCALHGHPPALPDGNPRIDFRLETLGSMLATLRLMGVSRICLAGAVRRPVIDPGLIDAATRPFMADLMAAMGKGDDGALRAVIGLLESHGFEVVPAEALAPDLLPPPGCPTVVQPGPPHARDALLAEAVIARMGRADQGQACMVRDGNVLAEEGPDGTDAMLGGLAVPPREASDPVSWMLDSAADLIGGAADWLSNAPTDRPGAGAILVKAAKPGQDRRADLPVIGPDTAARVVALGLAGIVIEAGSVMVLDRDRVIRTLDQGRAFLWVRPQGGGA